MVNLRFARGVRETDLVSWVVLVFCCARGGGVLLLVVKTMGTLESWLEIQEVGGASPPSEDAYVPLLEVRRIVHHVALPVSSSGWTSAQF